jgi:ATP-dependent protease HslVU (ClpYQ) peptidase subunit
MKTREEEIRYYLKSLEARMLDAPEVTYALIAVRNKEVVEFVTNVLVDGAPKTYATAKRQATDYQSIAERALEMAADSAQHAGYQEGLIKAKLHE